MATVTVKIQTHKRFKGMFIYYDVDNTILKVQKQIRKQGFNIFSNLSVDWAFNLLILFFMRDCATITVLCLPLDSVKTCCSCVHVVSFKQLLIPSLSQPVKFPGWKVHTQACKQCIFRFYDTCPFDANHFDRSPFTYYNAKKIKKDEGFLISHFYCHLFQTTWWQWRG